MRTTKFYFKTMEEAKEMAERTLRCVEEIGEEIRKNGEKWFFVKVLCW